MGAKSTILATLAFGLLVLTTSAAAAPGTQDFEIDEKAHHAFAGTSTIHTTPSPVAGGEIGLGPSECVLFAHDLSTPGAFTAPRADWVVKMFAREALGETGTFEIGSMGGGPETGVALSFVDSGLPGFQKATAITTTAGDMTIAGGDYLAAMFCDGGDGMLLQSGGSSHFSSPASAETYPTPELPALFMAAAGFALVGLFAARRYDL